MQLKNLTTAALVGVVVAQSNEPNLTALLQATPALSNLTTFVSSVPGLLETLGGASNITILAPSNDAFATFLTQENQAALAADPGLLAAVLSYHVLNGSYPASAVTESPQFLPSLLVNGSYANVTGGQRVGVQRNGQTVTWTSGLGMMSNVSQADVRFTGGVVHVIDSVLTVPTSASNTATAANLTALAGALTQANLVGTVDGLRDVTIFAPTNAAFQAIGSATANLTTEQLSAILTYHVIQGTVAYSNTLTNGSVGTVNGEDVNISISGGNVFVNSARVVQPNVLIAGGVVHVIDNVLNPENDDGPANPTGSNAPAFSGASSATNVPFTSGVAGPSSTGGSGGAATTGSATPASATGAAPMITGAVGAAALFGGAAILLNA